MGGHVVKSCPSTSTVGWKMKAWIAPRISSFKVGGPSFSVWSGGAISGMGRMVLQLLAARGNQSYPEFWVVTGNLHYTEY
jgi:hypothetical protein